MTDPEQKTEAPEELPRLRKDIEISPGQRQRDGTPAWLVHDPVRNRFLTIGWLEYEIIKRWPLRDPQQITNAILDQTTLDIVPDDIEALCDFLRDNDLIQSDAVMDSRLMAARAAAKQSMLEKKGLQRRVFFRFPLLRPDRFLQATLPFARLMTSRFALFLLAITALFSLYLVIRQWSAFELAFRTALSWQSAPWLLLALGLTKCFHELGHAWASKHFGLSIPTMGIAFFVVWPFLYTDTTAAWRLNNRRQRITVGAAGMASELYIAILATCLWSFLPDGVLRSAAFFLATASWMMTVVINSNPFMRWDGYYILSDAIQIENLHGRSFAFGRWKLRELLFGLNEPEPEAQSERMTIFLVWYAWGTWIYRIVLFVGLALLAYNFLFKALGIIAMLLALTWFIAGPLVDELKQWYERRSAMKFNLNTFITGCLLSALIGGAVYPWQRHIKAPAVVQSAKISPVYASGNGRLASVNIAAGSRVSTGQVLFSLQSDQLNYRQSIATIQVRRFESALTRQSEEDFLAQRDLLNEKLIKARTNAQGLDQQSSSLVVRAPFSGEITSISDALEPGQWVSDSLPVAMLVDRETLEIIAYVDEVQLGQLLEDASAIFFPEDPLQQKVKLRIEEIGSSRIQRLNEAVMAKPFGGAISVQDKFSLAPMKSLYPVRLVPIEPVGVHFGRAIIRGTVHFKSESSSLVAASTRHVLGVLRRESGF